MMENQVGTAGGPMLNILQKNNLCNVLVVVTRYFGGILLGTGGLVRAYSEATIKAIDEVNKVDIYPGVEYKVKVEYSELENFKYYCRRNEINITKIEYINEVEFYIEMKVESKDKFLEDINQRNINIIEQQYISDKLVKFDC